MGNKPKMSFNVNEPRRVKFSFSEGKRNDGERGEYFYYTVSEHGEECGIYATPNLNALLRHYQPLRDKTLTIEKVYKDQSDSITIFTVDGVSLDDVRKNGDIVATSTPSGNTTPTSTNAKEVWTAVNIIRKQTEVIIGFLENMEEKPEEKPEEKEFPF